MIFLNLYDQATSRRKQKKGHKTGTTVTFSEMGASNSRLLQPQELTTFKKLPTSVPLANLEIPEKPENRRPTNVKWLIVLAVFLALLLPFLIYTLYYADARRITSKYDQCGNFCGSKNYYWEGINCSGQDKTEYPYLEYTGLTKFHPSGWHEDLQTRHCVKECQPRFEPVLGRCVVIMNATDDNDERDIKSEAVNNDIKAYLNNAKWQIVVSCLLSVLVAVGMLFLFRFAVALVVWGIIIGCYIVLLILVIGLWYMYLKAMPHEAQPFLASAGTLTIFTIILGVILIWCRRKIKLVILLFKESGKAICSMPGLIACPVVCIFGISVVTLLFFITSFYISSAGVLQLGWEEYYLNYYSYVQNPVMIFTSAYNLVAFLWIVQFFTGIQYMVVAGAVSKWYFSRDKTNLGRPILTSLSNTFKFHLGTVALGALIITVMQVIKSVILGSIKNEKVRSFVRSCYEAVESFFKFLSKNAYIVTAMHGQAFIRSGKRAAKLLFQNAGDVIALNYFGDFVLGMVQLLVVLISVLLSMLVFTVIPTPVVAATHIWSYIIVAVVSLVVALISFGVFETTIDTIFICYCEDNLLNDGMARPYFMSRNLMEFVQKSKDLQGQK